MEEYEERSVKAAIWAHELLLESLVAVFLTQQGAGAVDMGNSLMEVVDRTDKITGVAKSEAEAELLSDVLVQTQERYRKIVGKASLRAEKALGL